MAQSVQSHLPLKLSHLIKEIMQRLRRHSPSFLGSINFSAIPAWPNVPHTHQSHTVNKYSWTMQARCSDSSSRQNACRGGPRTCSVIVQHLFSVHTVPRGMQMDYHVCHCRTTSLIKSGKGSSRSGIQSSSLD